MSHYKCVTAICNLCALADPGETPREQPLDGPIFSLFNGIFEKTMGWCIFLGIGATFYRTYWCKFDGRSFGFEGLV